MTIELGGNITLAGFSDRDFTELIVVKKIVGQYARKWNDTISPLDKLKVLLSNEGHGTLAIRIEVRIGEHETEGDAQDRNLFVALDAALKRAEEGLRKRHDREREARHHA